MNPRFLENMSDAMAEVYGAVTDQILINLAHYFPMLKDGQQVPGSFEYQARMLAQVGQVNTQTVSIIMKNLDGADQALREVLEAAIINALKDEDPKLRKAAEKGLLMGQGFIPPEVSPNQMQAFQAYYKQSADKLNLVNTVMLESTQNAYTATVSDIVSKIQRTQSILNIGTGDVVTGVSSFNQAVRQSVQKMVQNGLTGFIDHGGHHWSPEAYVAMDIRTTVANTARAAIWEEDERYGVDLYQVSHHDGARPLCYPWQGKVISRSDWTGEVEDDEGNKVHVYAQSDTSYGQAAGLFGVNCGHYPISFIPGFSRIRPPEQNEEQNAKEYAESQQQRALERKLREEKRDLAVLKAQGAPEDVIKVQRERTKEASRNLDDFCKETGRARRSGRESVGIDARWKDPDGNEIRRFGNNYYITDQKLYTSPKPIKTPQVEQTAPAAVEKTFTPTTVKDYDDEIQRLRSKRQALFDSDTYDKVETDRILSKIFSLEDERSKFISSIRPENEQEILKQFKRYDPARKTDAEKLKQVNPNFYSEGTFEWKNNCQRTVAAQELVYRGYDVTAMPYNANDAIGDHGLAVWNVRKDFWNDPECIVSPTRGEFIQTVSDAFQQWGEGSRAIVRVKWTQNYGNGGGHFLFARYKNGTVLYTDPQNGKIIDIAETIKNTTTSRNQMWVMRVDNRDVNDNIVLAVKNVSSEMTGGVK